MNLNSTSHGAAPNQVIYSSRSLPNIPFKNTGKALPREGCCFPTLLTLSPSHCISAFETIWFYTPACITSSSGTPVPCTF